MAKLGVLIVGVNGAVSSTVIAGVELMVKNHTARIGMVTEKTTAKGQPELADMLDVVPLEDIVFGGWDMKFANAYEAAVHHKALPLDKVELVKESLLKMKAWPAVSARGYADNVEGEHVQKVASHREQIAAIEADIKGFLAQHKTDRCVLVNLASTERWLELEPMHKSLAEFEKALDANHPSISPAMRYFYAAATLGLPYCNFAPSLTNIPALQEYAQKHGAPYAGMDGKTGQTLIKTALASMFRARRLEIEGWYSVNFLGNNDGKILDNPGSNKTKVMSKASVLDSILGYHVENHQVHIHYYKPRGDAKEAWDNIDIIGFAGVPMQMKINFLCQDSVLAAPLVLDLVRLLDVAKRRGQKGIQRQLSIFFKSPYAEPGEQPQHDFFVQEKMLFDWAKAHSTKA